MLERIAEGRTDLVFEMVLLVRENSSCFLYFCLAQPAASISDRGWSDVHVFRDWCIPDGKCESIADGRVWIDALDTPQKHTSGKYEIKLNDKLLEGSFVAKKRVRKPPLRWCM